MKNTVSRILLVASDAIAIFISLLLAYVLRSNIDSYFMTRLAHELHQYTGSIIIYSIIFISFIYSGLYRYRFDFWEETHKVFQSLLFSLIILFSLLAITKSVEGYSRFILIMAFVFMAGLIPLFKNITKKLLFRIGLWQRRAEIFGHEDMIKDEVFGNAYLGYVHSSHTDAQTIFIDTEGLSAEELQERLDVSLQEKKEVIFMPLLQSYNLSHARIIELSNARKNLVVLENSLLKRRNVYTKKVADMVLSLLLLPFITVLFFVIVLLMKKEEPKGSVLFKQKRMGQDGKEFWCYKFRSMYENGDKILENYLKNYPDEIACYNKYHKYKNDPRITQTGRFIRKTSLDELPQIINVLKGEMSLIGPRPYMLNEKEKIGEKISMVLAAKPGITGLWQVSGRSDLDFHCRVDIDIWYMRNWNLWMDLVILIKTVKTVLFKDGAK